MRIRNKALLGHAVFDNTVLFFTSTTHQILCPWVCSMVAGKVEFSEEEDAHIVADCVKVSS
jgi:hypothetical protein